MADNDSFAGEELIVKMISTRFAIVVQPLVLIFLCINALLIVTFFQKECFNTTARYILFAVTLVSDSVLLILSDVLLILKNLGVTMQRRFCVIICYVTLHFVIATPVTLTAMTLERYAAICMPLHHGQLCSTRNTVRCILIINGLSSLPCIAFLIVIFASAPPGFYFQPQKCAVTTIIAYGWQEYARSALYQFYFLIMCIIIVFSYIKIMKAAKAASGEDKRSSWKGLRTVVLHAFQLLLCLVQLWVPIMEANVRHTNHLLIANIRYFYYTTFFIAPRCLSPLIYGLRDEMFFHALKQNLFCGFFKTSPTFG